MRQYCGTTQQPHAALPPHTNPSFPLMIIPSGTILAAGNNFLQVGRARRHLQQSDLVQDCAGNQILSMVKVEKQKPSATIGLGGEVGRQSYTGVVCYPDR